MSKGNYHLAVVEKRDAVLCPAVADVTQEAKDVARGPFGEAVARWGLVSKGALYVLVGVIAADVAIGGGERLRDRGGAVSAVADTWYGKVLVFLVAIGLAGYAAWRFAQGVLGRPLEGGKKESWPKRIGFFARAGWYLFLLWVVLAALAGADEEGGSREEDRATARVLDWPLGRWIVAAVGLGIFGAGVFNYWRGITQSFKKKLKLSKILQEDYGDTMLGIVSAGLIAYGLYSFVEARYREV